MTRSRPTALRGGFRHIDLHVCRAREEALAGQDGVAVLQLRYAERQIKKMIDAIETRISIPIPECLCDKSPKEAIDEGTDDRTAR